MNKGHFTFVDMITKEQPTIDSVDTQVLKSEVKLLRAMLITQEQMTADVNRWYKTLQDVHYGSLPF